MKNKLHINFHAAVCALLLVIYAYILSSFDGSVHGWLRVLLWSLMAFGLVSLFERGFWELAKARFEMFVTGDKCYRQWYLKVGFREIWLQPGQEIVLRATSDKQSVTVSEGADEHKV